MNRVAHSYGAWAARIGRFAGLLAAAVALACVTATPADEQPLFSFGSNFWLNLHHFLRAAGRGLPIEADMSPEERAAWDRAVEVYQAGYSQRDILRDEELLSIKAALMSADGKSTLAEASISPELRDHLESVAPVYRRHFWAEHDAANRAWIDNAARLVREHGAAIAPRVAAAYGETWPTEPIRVDMTVSAGPDGAYTTYPPHVTVASIGHPENQHLASLELLFHESSHQWGRRLSQLIAESAEARGKSVPRGLWHAVLFYNAEEITRRVLEHAGTPYDGYASEDVYEDLCGEGCRAKVAAAWNRRLDGGSSIQAALDRLVADF